MLQWGKSRGPEKGYLTLAWGQGRPWGSVMSTWGTSFGWMKTVPSRGYSLKNQEVTKNTKPLMHKKWLPGGSDGKVSAYNVGDLGSIPGSRRSSGEGNGNPLQYCCLENPMDGGAWWAAICGVAQSWTRLKWLSSSSIFHTEKNKKIT